MVTPIVNKASEVRAWLERVQASGGEVGHIDVRAYIKKRWPDLLLSIREDIFEASTR